MFNCYQHGWSHIQNACPLCHPVQTWTSSSTDIRIGSLAYQSDLAQESEIIAQLEDRVYVLETFMKSLYSSKDIPKDVKQILKKVLED